VQRHRGWVVQIDPIKPILKAPGTKRFKLRYDGPLSNFAFKFHLRHYIVDHVAEVSSMKHRMSRMVGRCRLTL